MQLVERILRSDPELWKAAGGDEFVGELPDDDSVYYLVCRHDEHGLLGLCIFNAVEPGVYRGHANFLPKHWGVARDATQQATQQCCEWMFEHTDCSCIEASVPNEYLPVQLFAERIGMQCVAIDDNSKHYELRKNGNT